MAQEFINLISGMPGDGTPFSEYPRVINSMTDACRSDFSGGKPPQNPLIGQTYFNTTDKRQYRYFGRSEGWVPSIASDSSVSDIEKEIKEARGDEVRLVNRLIKISTLCANFKFPKGEDVRIGTPCYRTDLKALYICTAKGSGGAEDTWTDISEVSPNVNNVEREIKEARGIAKTLGARLDVSLNHDGTLKGTAPAGEWWEPVTPYGFKKISEHKLELLAGGDLTAVFEVGRAVLMHPSHRTGYVKSSEHSVETDKTSITVEHSLAEGDNLIQFGAPLGNHSKVELSDPDIKDAVDYSKKLWVATVRTVGEVDKILTTLHEGAIVYVDPDYRG